MTSEYRQRVYWYMWWYFTYGLGIAALVWTAPYLWGWWS